MSPSELVLEFAAPRVETGDELAEIEDALAEMLGDGEGPASREPGAGEREIRILTRDPAATFARVAPFLVRAELIDHVVARSHSPSAPAVPLWPPPR
jgi:hypothetical protein